MNRSVKVTWLAAAGAVFAMVMAACGGGEATATPVPPTVTPRPAATQPPAAPAAAPTATPRPSTPAPTPTAVPATPTPAGPQPKYGGSFSMRIVSDFTPWDTTDSLGHFAAIILQNLMNNIITAKPDDLGALRPDLATTWTISADGTVWTFKLRADVRFHDGIALTAKDVVHTLDRARNPTDPRLASQKPRLNSIDTVQAVDDATVRVTLKRPSPVFQAALTVPSLLVYPSHVPDVTGAWAAKPVGSGSFTFKSLNKGVSAEFTRNAQYFRKDAAGRALPYLDSLSYFVIVDQQNMLGAFYSGRLDCLCGYSSDLLPGAIDGVRKQVPNARIELAKGMVPASMHFNQRPPFNNQKARQAVHIGVDRQELNAVWQLGTGYYPPSLLTPRAIGGQWALPDDEVLKLPGFRDPHAQDVTLARQLLKDAGVDPSTFSIRILSPTKYSSVATTLDSHFVGLGFKRSDIALMDNPAARAEIDRGNFDVNITEVGGTIDDPSDPIFLRVLTGGARNDGKWSLPELDALAVKLDTEIDTAKRRELAYQFQRKLYELSPEVPLISQAIGFATAGYVEGFALKRASIVSSAHRMEEVWLNK